MKKITIDNITIYQEECQTAIDNIEDKSIKLIYGSPPYPNAKRDYGKWDEDEYIEFISPFLKKAVNKLDDQGFLVINVKANRKKKKTNHCSERSLIIEELMLYIKKQLGLYCVDIEIWIKSNPAPTSVKSACMDAYEYILWFSKAPNWKINIDSIRKSYSPVSLKMYKEQIYKKRKNSLYVTRNKKIEPNPKGALPKNNFIDELKKEIVFDMNKFVQDYYSDSNIVYGSTSSKKTNHQAIQPEYLPRKYILACTNENDLVLDPWLGSGTTGIVAKKLKRKFIGFEKEKKFVDLSLTNIKEVESE